MAVRIGSSLMAARIEQDHRAIKQRVGPMLGFQSMATARVILGGIEMVHMMYEIPNSRMRSRMNVRDVISWSAQYRLVYTAPRACSRERCVTSSMVSAFCSG